METGSWLEPDPSYCAPSAPPGRNDQGGSKTTEEKEEEEPFQPMSLTYQRLTDKKRLNLSVEKKESEMTQAAMIKEPKAWKEMRKEVMEIEGGMVVPANDRAFKSKKEKDLYK